jgi:uncharacterized protein (DUF1778 family)
MSMVRSSTAKKTERHEFRLTPVQKEIIARAAAISGKNVTDFILESTVLAAEMTILDQRVFGVSATEFSWWEDLLEAEPQPNPGLDRLFSKPISWSKD